jgi:NAD(P) transhydrogenase subunit alpha
MRPGSVLIDLAVEQGGNVEGVVRGEVTTAAGGVRVIGFENLPGRVAVDASTLYARNLHAFVQLLFQHVDGTAPETRDDILDAARVVRGGAILFPAV